MANQTLKRDRGRTRRSPKTGRTRPAPGRLRRSAPASGKRLPGEERKAKIVDAALALFARSGFSGTTTKAIARAAGISEATMFQHFATKDDLYIAAFEQKAGEGIELFIARLQEHADRGEDEALIRVLVQAIIDGYSAQRDLQRLLLFAWLDQERVANTHMWRNMKHFPLFDFLRSYIVRRQADGVFRRGDPDLLVLMLISFPVHYAIRTKLYGIEPEASDDAVAKAYAQLFLEGAQIAPRAATSGDPS